MSNILEELHDFSLYDRVKTDFEQIFAATLNLPDHTVYERHFIWGAMRRTHSLSLAMRQSIEAKNGQMTATLIRLNLDTLARFYALYWADETPELTSETLSKEVFDGRSIKDLKLRGAKEKATDRWLIEQITGLANWIPEVYKNASGAIHFSESHIHQVISSQSHTEETMPDSEFQIAQVSMSPVDQNPNLTDYRNAKTAFLHISMMLAGAMKHRVEQLAI